MYDGNGNQKSSTGLSSISWDANGLPVSVTPLSGGAISGTYDAFGRLVENGAGGTYTQFIFSPAGEKIDLARPKSSSKSGCPILRPASSCVGWDFRTLALERSYELVASS